jgi:hypothetical protein
MRAKREERSKVREEGKAAKLCWRGEDNRGRGGHLAHLLQLIGGEGFHLLLLLPPCHLVELVPVLVDLV